MPGGGIHLRSIRALEQKLQCELNQPRVVGLGGYYPKAVISCTGRCSVEAGTRESELNSIESVEEFSSELNAKLVFRAEGRRLEQGKVPVVDSGRTKAGVNAGFCTVSPKRRCGKAAGVKPLV